MPKRLSSKPSENDADHDETDECDNGCGKALELRGQAAVAIDPGKSPFDHPSLG